MTNFLLFLLLIAAIAVNIQLRKLNMTIQEYADKMDELAQQLNKALQEILTAIGNLGNVPQVLVDKLDAAKALAQQLDDLNPDPPTP